MSAELRFTLPLPEPLDGVRGGEREEECSSANCCGCGVTACCTDDAGRGRAEAVAVDVEEEEGDLLDGDLAGPRARLRSLALSTAFASSCRSRGVGLAGLEDAGMRAFDGQRAST